MHLFIAPANRLACELQAGGFTVPVCSSWLADFYGPLHTSTLFPHLHLSFSFSCWAVLSCVGRWCFDSCEGGFPQGDSGFFQTQAQPCTDNCSRNIFVFCGLYVLSLGESFMYFLLYTKHLALCERMHIIRLFLCQRFKPTPFYDEN